MLDLKARLALALGYSVRQLDGTGTSRLQIPDFDANSAIQIERLLAEISATDTSYQSALADSMALKVDTLEVDYAQHLALISARGTLLLKRLEAFTHVPLVFNQFTGSRVSINQSTSGSVMYRSYY